MMFVGMTVEQVVETLVEMGEGFDLWEDDGEVMSVMLDDTELFVEDDVVVSVVAMED